jgi:hypothetical protein
MTTCNPNDDINRTLTPLTDEWRDYHDYEYQLARDIRNFPFLGTDAENVLPIKPMYWPKGD